MDHLVSIPILAIVAASLPAQIHVAPTGSNANTGTATSPFLTINHAASVAAPGTTIHLHAGTYGDEQGIVQLGAKDLVIAGAGTESTVLHPHSTATTALLPADPAASSTLPHRVGILVSGAARVDLRDLTIDAQRITPASGQVAGIYVRGGADVVCDRVAVIECRPAVLGSGLSHAVVVRGDLPTDPSTVTARRSSFLGFGDGGVRAMLRAEIDLQECSLSGSGARAGGVTQVGVRVEAAAVGSVRLSRMTDCGGPEGACLMFDGHRGCTVHGNRLGRAAFGVDLRQAPPAIVPGSLHDNRIAEVDTTIRVRGVSGVVIEGNSLFPVSRFDPRPYWDDTTTGNSWRSNRYPVLPGTTSVAIPGGNNVDPTPISGTSELQDVERVACGGAPVGVVVADFDGDGHEDFATLDRTAAGAGISVGLWRPAAHIVGVLPFGNSELQPVALVAGEFDGLSGADLVALTAPVPPSTGGAAFWVFANDGGGGMSLLHREDLTGWVMPSALAQASFNANAVADLVVLDLGAPPLSPGGGSTFLNDGTGTTWFATRLPAAFTEAAVAAATGDIDGDGKVDLAIAEGSPTSGRVHWLLGNGIGFFAPAAASPFAVAANPLDVLIGDVDADGDRDILATCAGGALPLQRGTLLLLENDAGALAAWPPRPTEYGPLRALLVDLDADDFLAVRPEVILLDVSAGGLSVLGAFEQATGFAGGGLSTLADGPVDLATGDFDGDRFADVIVAEPARGGVALLHGSPTARVATFGAGCPGAAGREPRLESLGETGIPTQPNPTLQIGLADAAPLSLGVFALASSPAPTFTRCNYLLTSAISTWLVVTDSGGRAAINLPLPAVPDVRGLPLWFQAGVRDPAATTSFFPGFSLTAGLHLRIGD